MLASSLIYIFLASKVLPLEPRILKQALFLSVSMMLLKHPSALKDALTALKMLQELLQLLLEDRGGRSVAERRARVLAPFPFFLKAEGSCAHTEGATMGPGRLGPGSPLEPLRVMTRNRPALSHPGSAELVRRAPSLARTGLGLLGTAVGIGLAVGAGLGRGAEERLEPGEVARSLSESYVDVAARVAPAVVRIEAFAAAGGIERPLGQGSGVILSEDGSVVKGSYEKNGKYSPRDRRSYIGADPVLAKLAEMYPTKPAG